MLASKVCKVVPSQQNSSLRGYQVTEGDARLHPKERETCVSFELRAHECLGIARHGVEEQMGQGLKDSIPRWHHIFPLAILGTSDFNPHDESSSSAGPQDTLLVERLRPSAVLAKLKTAVYS